MGGAKAIPINPVHRKMMGFAALYPSYALLNLRRRRRCRDSPRAVSLGCARARERNGIVAIANLFTPDSHRQERRYLMRAAAARSKTMMTSNQTAPMPHIIPEVMPSIIMAQLAVATREPRVARN